MVDAGSNGRFGNGAPKMNLAETQGAKSREAALFFRAWLRAPLRIAALLPSSATTGRVMAGLVPPDDGGGAAVLELGAGTGAIGQGLLASGVAASRLIMVEREPALVDHLRARFPGVRVLCADAAALAGHDLPPLAAVVSTLPIVWFSPAGQEAVVGASFARLGPGAPFLQLTNQPASPLPAARLGLRAERAAMVWRNLPPSFIWRYWTD